MDNVHHITHRISPRHRYVAGGGALLVFVVAALWYAMSERHVTVQEVSPPDSFTLVRADTVPLAIEGVRVAKDDVMLSAQTAGTITGVPVREGDLVARGDILVLVGQPVLAAQREALLARIRTVEAQRAQVQVAVEGERATSEVRVEAGRDTGSGSVSLAESEYEVAREALVATLSRTYLSAIGALTYLAETTALSSGEVVALRVEVARMLGGSQRSQYLGESIRGGGSVPGIADALARASDDPRAVVDAELSSLTDTMRRALPLLARAYGLAERAVYERGSDITPLAREEYVTYRAGVRDAQSSLEGAVGAYERAMRALTLARARAEGDIAVSESQVRYATQATRSEGAVTDATLIELSAQLRALDATLGEAVVRAPYAGVVTAVHADVGGYVVAGAPLVRVQGVDGFEVHATVPVRYRAGLSAGAPIVFAHGERGVLDRITPQVDARAGGVPVFFTLLDVDTSYLAGERVRGELALTPDVKTPVYAIPHAYVTFAFSGPVVRTETGTVPVVVVRDTREYFYVTGEGVREGAHVLR